MLRRRQSTAARRSRRLIGMHEFKRFIQQQLDARGWTQADLVRKSGLSKQHVSNLLRDTREHLGQMPTEKTIRALAEGFQMPAEVVRTAASRALAGYSDEGQPLHVDIHQVPLDTLLNEIRRRFEEIGEHHGADTEEEQEPRTQARGPEHSSEARGDRRRTGASMTRVNVTQLKTPEHNPDPGHHLPAPRIEDAIAAREGNPESR